MTTICQNETLILSYGSSLSQRLRSLFACGSKRLFEKNLTTHRPFDSLQRQPINSRDRCMLIACKYYTLSHPKDLSAHKKNAPSKRGVTGLIFRSKDSRIGILLFVLGNHGSRSQRRCHRHVWNRNGSCSWFCFTPTPFCLGLTPFFR